MTDPIQDSKDSRELAALEAELRQLTPPEPPAGLEAALISAIPPNVRLRRAAKPFRWRFAASAAAAAAAILLVCISVHVNGRAQERGNPMPPPAPRAFAAPSHLPQASWAAYCRAWLQSAGALDRMLSRDERALLRPERSPAATDLDIRRFLKTMDLIEEQRDENHSMRGNAIGALV
jgi:hypothetical protein